MFQSTPFARRETTISVSYRPYKCVSIHSLRKKGDGTPDVLFDCRESFQSTPFARRETFSSDDETHAVMFQSTPFARRETFFARLIISPIMFQSTPFARRETLLCRAGSSTLTVSIHSLRKKGDLRNTVKMSAVATFQSTPFARRETFSPFFGR